MSEQMAKQKVECPDCRGEGIEYNPEYVGGQNPCSRCHGLGYLGEHQVYCWRCFRQFAAGECLRDQYGEWECSECTRAMIQSRLVILEEGQRHENVALGILVVGIAGAVCWAVLIWCAFDGPRWINHLLRHTR